MKSIDRIKKATFATLLTFTFSLSSVFAQNDTMYVMKNGAVINKQSVKPADVDSVIFYKPTVAQNNTAGTFTDSRDKNTYKWVKIGSQVWMAENLAYLPSVNKVADGSEDVAGKYYYVYGYDGTNVADAKATANYTTYGVLYNWAAAVQGVCPTGWHLPSDDEWTALTDNLGGTNNAGGKLKEAGTTHWEIPNTGATNESNFTALPGGDRYINNSYHLIGEYGTWWSSTQSPYDQNGAYGRGMDKDFSVAFKYYHNKELGFSVRCVRD